MFSLLVCLVVAAFVSEYKEIKEKRVKKEKEMKVL